jgi:signal transduction histidine kinase
LIESLNKLLNYFFHIENPVLAAVLFVAFVLSFIVIVFKYLVFPLANKFEKEKELIELRSAKLMSLFAQLDPDPLIRINNAGTILVSNYALKDIFNDENFLGRNINEFLPDLNLPLGDNFTSTTMKFVKKINNKYFLILYRSNAELNIGHLYFRDITEQKEAEEKLFSYQKQLKKFSEELQNKIEEERNQISKTLHDSIGQSLSLLRIKLNSCKEDAVEPKQKKEYEEFISTIEEIITELKSISHSLKPRALESMGLKMAITHLINDISEGTGIIGELNFADEDLRYDEKLEINLFRIVQESLNNILKYAQATKFGVQLINSKNSIRLIISDNGKGFNPEEVLKNSGLNGGMGLLNIKERVESFGGNLKIDSNEKDGTILIIEIPIKNYEYEHT